MDSVSQVVLGASVAAVCVPKEHRRKAILAGAALGTLPDLDILIDYGDAVSNFTLHRGFSHSLFVLIPFSVVLWSISRYFFKTVREAPKAWFWAIMLSLVTHPLLDAHTAYGTQLLWPLDVTPAMWANLFIIDPLYTLPLLIGMLAVLIAPRARLTTSIVKTGLVISCLYISWTWVAKYQVTQKALAATQLSDEIRVFATPTPFNSLMWRLVVLSGDTYQEGYYHFIFPGDIEFNTYQIDRALFKEAAHVTSIDQLQWFADGFNRIDILEDKLVVSDLRMGYEDNYAFRHIVANMEGDTWVEITSEQLPSQLTSEDFDGFWAAFTNKQD